MKRYIDSLGDLESPSSRKKLRAIAGYFDRPRKRRIGESSFETMSDPSPKRVTRQRLDNLTHDGDAGYVDQSLPGPETLDSVYFFRARIYMYFQSELNEVNEENFWMFMTQIYEETDRVGLAEVMHVCPQDLRLAILRKLDPLSESNILSEITDLERQKQKNDPKSIFPTIMTDILASEYKRRPICNICQHGFCDANKKPVPIEDVVKKACGSHMMHWACFRQKVIDGEMPLHGPCPCFGDISTKMEH